MESPRSTGKQRAVFLDLNGTLVMPLLVARPSEYELIDGVAEALARLTAAGFTCPVITVQSRIEKGLFTENELLTWFEGLADRLARTGAVVSGPYLCPHRFATRCPCAKPQTLLYERSAADCALSLPDSFVVGDTAADMEAATRLGARGFLVRTGYAARDEEASEAGRFASASGRTMCDAVDWILTR